jgi:dTDP-4-dehydrorhamnose reductase
VCDRDGINCVALSHDDLDIRNPVALMYTLRQVEPTAVVNAAGIVGINVCEDDPLRAFSVNTIPVCYLADLCEKLGIILVQPSTHNVFDGTKDGYYTEEDLPRPIQIYGTTRYASEKIAVKCNTHYIVRYPTLFGKRMNGRSAFPDKIIDWIKEGKEFNISYDKVDSPSWSMDVANATVKLVVQGFPYGTYHIANSGCTNYYEFVQKISSLVGVEAKVTRVKEQTFETKAPNALKTAMSSVKLPPLRTWDEALEEYLRGR